MRAIKYSAVAGLLSLALGACVQLPLAQTGTYVSALPTDDAQVLAHAMTGYLKDRLPPAATTLALVLPPAPALGAQSVASATPSPVDALTPVLTQDLKSAGFALATTAQKVPAAHVVMYVVEPFDGGVLLHLKIDGYSASQYFVRNTKGTLQPGSPISVQEVQ